MGEFVPDRRTPFYWRCMEIDGAIFPRAREKAVRALSHIAGPPGGHPIRWQSREMLLKKLRGMKTDRQLERYLAERVGLKDLLTLWWASLSFLRVLATFDVDQPAYQRAREMIGREPTRLKYLRGVLRFWIEPFP